MKQKIIQNYGITLIALVVTIVLNCVCHEKMIMMYRNTLQSSL